MASRPYGRTAVSKTSRPEIQQTVAVIHLRFLTGMQHPSDRKSNKQNAAQNKYSKKYAFKNLVNRSEYCHKLFHCFPPLSTVFRLRSILIPRFATYAHTTYIVRQYIAIWYIDYNRLSRFMQVNKRYQTQQNSKQSISLWRGSHRCTFSFPLLMRGAKMQSYKQNRKNATRK